LHLLTLPQLLLVLPYLLLLLPPVLLRQHLWRHLSKQQQHVQKPAQQYYSCLCYCCLGAAEATPVACHGLLLLLLLLLLVLQQQALRVLLGVPLDCCWC
jgi:hypothetical protein